MTAAQKIIRALASRGITLVVAPGHHRPDGEPKIRATPADKLEPADRAGIANHRAAIIAELRSPFVHDWPYIDRRRLRVHFFHVNSPLGQAPKIILVAPDPSLRTPSDKRSRKPRQEPSPYSPLSGPLLQELAQAITDKLPANSESLSEASRRLSDCASFLAAQPEYIRLAAAATYQPTSGPAASQYRASLAQISQESLSLTKAGILPANGLDASKAKAIGLD